MTTNRSPRKSTTSKSGATSRKRRAMGPPEEIGDAKPQGNRLNLVLYLLLFGGFVFAVVFLSSPGKVVGLAPQGIQTAIPFAGPSRTPTLIPPLVALLAGHSGGEDPGAICPDGLREVEITTDVAQRAKALLEARGYRVDILAEYDVRLSKARRDYSPKVFLSLHVDSCINLSGYKIARAEYSATPQEDDRLVRCVGRSYGLATRLAFDENTITPAMRQYHALDKIDPNAPAAILELGFLGGDKNLLKNNRELLATAVTDGIERFMRGDVCQ